MCKSSMDGDCLDCRVRKAGHRERMQQQGGASILVIIAGPSPEELPGEFLLGKVRLVAVEVNPDTSRGWHLLPLFPSVFPCQNWFPFLASSKLVKKLLKSINWNRF